jgi:hypothetical protein
MTALATTAEVRAAISLALAPIVPLPDAYEACEESELSCGS